MQLCYVVWLFDCLVVMLFGWLVGWLDVGLLFGCFIVMMFCRFVVSFLVIL